MNVRTLRAGLLCFAVVSVAASILAVVLATAMPLSVAPDNPSASKQNPAASLQSPRSKSPPLFADVATVELRHSLVDGPPPVAAVEPEPVQSAVAAPSIRLLGTVIEPGHSMALLADSTGKCEFKSVGDVVDGAAIVDIRDGLATVQWNDRRIDLTIPPDAAVTSPASAAVAASVMGASNIGVPGPATTSNAPGENHGKAVPEASMDEKEMRAFLNRKPTLEDN